MEIEFELKETSTAFGKIRPHSHFVSGGILYVKVRNVKLDTSDKVFNSMLFKNGRFVNFGDEEVVRPVKVLKVTVADEGEIV